LFLCTGNGEDKGGRLSTATRKEHPCPAKVPSAAEAGPERDALTARLKPRPFKAAGFSGTFKAPSVEMTAGGPMQVEKTKS
jgi:hypothetical protein